MPDKVEKPKKSKTKSRKDEQGVLAALPSTRPQRIGTRRVSAPGTPAVPEAAPATGARARAKPAAAKRTTPKTSGAAAKAAAPKASAKSTAAKSSAGGAKAAATRTSAAGRKPAAPKTSGRKAPAPHTFAPTRAAESAADERTTGAPPPPAPEPRPRAVREGAPGMGTIGERDQPSPEHGRPSGTELVSTAVQAAGELTQIGLKIGGRLVKRAVDRLPKP